MVHRIVTVFAIALLAAACSSAGQQASSPPAAGSVEGLTAFVGARVIDGSGRRAIPAAVMLVRDGRIEAVGSGTEITIPDGAERIDVRDRTVIPGLINTHGHVGDTRGLEAGHYSERNVLDHLALYARYGVTTVNSLGGDQAIAADVRAAQGDLSLSRARLLFAGPVVTSTTAADAAAQVDEIAAMRPDFIKIRVDDNLGTTSKMSPDVYQATIESAHDNGLRLASHVFYLEDAKLLLQAGTDFIAHSVRDQPVDEEFIALLRANEVCYSPTLTREISTFVYAERPDFFDDPFFLAEVDAQVIAALEDPVRQQSYRTEAAESYKAALQVALTNLKKVADGGAKVAMGTDSGPPARFPGYFEHLELELMAEAGLTPLQVIVASTGDAARCLGLQDVGTLEPGKLADFVVLTGDPLADITATRSIESVWINGNRVPRDD